VPATLPDMLKTRAVLEWEYEPATGPDGRTGDRRLEDRLDWMRASPSDYEIALPLHEIESFRRREGYYAGLPANCAGRRSTG
jgi:hypothetical protein